MRHWSHDLVKNKPTRPMMHPQGLAVDGSGGGGGNAGGGSGGCSVGRLGGGCDITWDDSLLTDVDF